MMIIIHTLYGAFINPFNQSLSPLAHLTSHT